MLNVDGNDELRKVNERRWLVPFGMCGKCRRLECASEQKTGYPGYARFRVTWISTTCPCVQVSNDIDSLLLMEAYTVLVVVNVVSFW
jgi:hypothetical protein